MVSFEYTIKDKAGIHARPAGLLVKEAQKLGSETEIICKGKKANLKKLFAVMSLAVKCGDTVRICVSGENEKSDSEEIKNFLENNL